MRCIENLRPLLSPPVKGIMPEGEELLKPGIRVDH